VADKLKAYKTVPFPERRSLVKRYVPGDISAKRVQLPELIANASGVTPATLALK